jgi:small subunit ribosomal protein S16
MLKIKLSPVGKKNHPDYRIVVAEDRSKLTGNNLAIIGHYNPISGEVKLDKNQVELWVSKGAQTTARVKKLYNNLTKKS